MIISTLSIDLSFIENDAIIALFAYLILYLTYYFFNDFSFVIRIRNQFNETKDDYEKSVYLRRTIGLVLLGIVPFVIVLLFFDRSIYSYGVSLPSGDNVLLWFIIPVIIFTLGSILKSSKTIDTSYYPEVRKKTWTRKRTILNIVFWMIYLLGYEFGIRGMLFFALLYQFGLWPAIIVNSVIYSLIHIFKGYKEAYGAFFLGVALCLITYNTNSIWIAYILHVILAVTNDIKAVKASNEMEYKL